MALFRQKRFDSGTWAGPLARALRDRALIPDRHPKGRVYRHRWTHWVQFEPIGYSGPAQWLGKPAVMVDDNALLPGYYIERGFRSHDRPEYVMTPEWHWYAFERCLADADRRARINSLLQQLDSRRRCVTIFCGDERLQLEYRDAGTLDLVVERTRSCAEDQWIDLVLGLRIPFDDCLKHQDAVIRSHLAPALMRARDIEQVVLETREQLLSTNDGAQGVG